MDLTRGAVLAKSPAIKPLTIDLSGSYDGTADVDSSRGTVKITNSTDLETARISSFSPLGAYDEENNIVTVSAQMRFDTEDTEHSEIGYIPGDTARLVDSKGNVYSGSIGRSSEDEEFLPLGKRELATFAFSVPRDVYEFELIWSPLVSFANTPDVRFTPKEVSLNFGAE